MHKVELKVTILIPVYNDWDSFYVLINELENIFSNHEENRNLSISIMAVDDGSQTEPDLSKMDDGKKFFDGIEILHLHTNIGHQRAIAVALSYLETHLSSDAVLVMDADGEDRPVDALELIKAHIEHPGDIILASRGKRSEGLFFRMGYGIYRGLFSILSGSNITFGNFCLIPALLLPALVRNSDLWNHFASTVVKSKLPRFLISTERGRRFIGGSQMDIVSLVGHGLSSISVHIETVAVRMLLGTIFLVAISTMGFLTVTLIRLFTDLAIPGWASTVGLAFIAIAAQGVMMAVLLTFIVLNNRQQLSFIPHVEFSKYVREFKKIK